MLLFTSINMVDFLWFTSLLQFTVTHFMFVASLNKYFTWKHDM